MAALEPDHRAGGVLDRHNLRDPFNRTPQTKGFRVGFSAIGAGAAVQEGAGRWHVADPAEIHGADYFDLTPDDDQR